MLQVDTMPRERTFIMIKPDGVQRGLVAKIIARFEEKGFKLVAMKFSQPSKEHLETHYADLKEKKFFPGLISYMTSGPVVPMVRAISCAESVHAAAARRASRGGAAVRNGSQAAPSDSAAALFSGSCGRATSLKWLWRGISSVSSKIRSSKPEVACGHTGTNKPR